MEEGRGTGLRASGVFDMSGKRVLIRLVLGTGGEPLVLSLGQQSPSESRQAAQLTSGRRNLETSKEETIGGEARRRHRELKLLGGCGAAAPRQGLAAALGSACSSVRPVGSEGWRQSWRLQSPACSRQRVPCLRWIRGLSAETVSKGRSEQASYS